MKLPGLHSNTSDLAVVMPEMVMELVWRPHALESMSAAACQGSTFSGCSCAGMCSAAPDCCGCGSKQSFSSKVIRLRHLECSITQQAAQA